MSERERDVLLLLRSVGTCFDYYLYDQLEYTRIQCSPVVRLYCPVCVCVAGDAVMRWGKGDALVVDPCRCRHARPGGRSWEVDGVSGALEVVDVGEMSVRL